MSVSGAALSSMLKYPDKKTLSKEKLNFIKETNLKENKIPAAANTGNPLKQNKNPLIQNQINQSSLIKKQIKDASNFENLMEKLKQNKNESRLFKKENFNFKSENTFNNLNQPLKHKIKASEKEFTTISYREDNTDHITYTEENSEISSLLNNIKNLKTEENRRNTNLNKNKNNNSLSFHTISSTNRTMVSNNNKVAKNNINNNNNNPSININNINSFYNVLNNNKHLEIIVEQSDTIRCSSQNNTATLASMGLTNKKNAYDEIFMATNNSKSNKSNSKTLNNNNNTADVNVNSNNPFYFKNHLNTQREILIRKKDTDVQISEKDLLDEFATCEAKLNDYNKSMDMNNLQIFQMANADLSSLNNIDNSNLLINNESNFCKKEEEKNRVLVKNLNENNSKKNNFFVKRNHCNHVNNNENATETHRNHQDLENVIRNKLLNKNRMSQNSSIIKSTFDIKNSETNLNFNLNNSYENNNLNAKKNDFIIENEMSGRYINNYTEANISSASNNIRINKSSNIVNNNLLINNNFFIESKNFVNNQINNCIIIDSKNDLATAGKNDNYVLKHNFNATKVLNKNAFVQSKEKLSKNTSQTNISSIHMNSNSVISELNPFTNRTFTNIENNNVNFNILVSKNNVADNLNANNNNNQVVFDEANVREKTLSTKNANAANNNFSFNLSNNNNMNLNTFRSNKNNSINLNHNNKEISLNKLSNLNYITNQDNQLVKLKNDILTNNINNNNQRRTLPNNEKQQQNNQAQQIQRKGSIGIEKSSNGKEKPKSKKEEKQEEAKTKNIDKINSNNTINNKTNISNINNNNHNFCINLDQNFYQVNNYHYFLNKSSSSNNNNNKREESKQTPYELLQEIFENLLKEEREALKQFGYMKKQINTNENMRAILIDWIIEVHYKFKLLPETLFLTINLIDRFLTGKCDIAKETLQLAGIAAMLIACKYEEIYSPELRDFVYISDKSYESEDILKMESEMLKILKFEICFPSVNRFFEILTIIYNFSEKEIVLGKYLSEIFLIDYRYTKYSSSLIACAVSYLIKKDERKDKLKDLLNLSQSDISVFKECVKDICFIVEHIEQTELIAIKKKYASKENYKFAKLKMLDLL